MGDLCKARVSQLVLYNFRLSKIYKIKQFSGGKYDPLFSSQAKYELEWEESDNCLAGQKYIKRIGM